MLQYRVMMMHDKYISKWRHSQNKMTMLPQEKNSTFFCLFFVSFEKFVSMMKIYIEIVFLCCHEWNQSFSPTSLFSIFLSRYEK